MILARVYREKHCVVRQLSNSQHKVAPPTGLSEKQRNKTRESAKKLKQHNDGGVDLGVGCATKATQVYPREDQSNRRESEPGRNRTASGCSASSREKGRKW